MLFDGLLNIIHLDSSELLQKMDWVVVGRQGAHGVRVVAFSL
jgi:hypothetical protein